MGNQPPPHTFNLSGVMGPVLQTVIVVLGRWRYTPLLFVLIALIFVLAEIYWFSTSKPRN